MMRGKKARALRREAEKLTTGKPKEETRKVYQNLKAKKK